MASEIKVDTISEKTSANGVTIDGVKLKDSVVEVDTISEKTSGSGVTIDGVNIKDGTITGANLGRKNYIINGNFDIWQRGTSETGRTSSGYVADRWFINPSGGSVDSSRETFTVGQTDVPNNPEYFYRFENTVANDNVGLWQKIEGVRTFSGQTITISFYAKYTTNKPTNLFIDINQDFGVGGSSDVSTDVFDGTNPYTTSWQKFTYTVTVPSISGKTIGTGDNIQIRFGNKTNETFDFDIAQVQVEVGSVATDFEMQHPGDILLQCRRYFHFVTIWSGNWVSYPSGFAFGNGNGTGSARITYESPSMQNFRTTPTVSWEGDNNQSGSFRSHRLSDNNFSDTQFVQSVSFGFDPWYDGGATQGLCQMHILWGSTISTGTFSNQNHYRMSGIANSPKIRVLLDAEL